MRNVSWALAGIGFLFLTACTSVYHLPVEKTPESLKESTMNGQSVVVSFRDSLWSLDSARINGDTVYGNSRIILDTIWEVDPTASMSGNSYSGKYRISKIVAAPKSRLQRGQILLYMKNETTLFNDTLSHPAKIHLSTDVDSTKIRKLNRVNTTILVGNLVFYFLLLPVGLVYMFNGGWGGIGF